jgi:hypothetical protein
MTELEGKKGLYRYYKKISPLEIDINKDEIFYRDKYNEIMNYIKSMFTKSQDNQIHNYLKPKGTLIININPGSDILDFIKVIAKNYYLEIFQLNLAEVIKSSNDPLKILYKIIEEIDEIGLNQEKNNKMEIDKEKDVVKRIILVDQKELYANAPKNASILSKILGNYQNANSSFNFLEKNLILIWLNYNYNEIIDFSSELFDIFDLFIKIPTLTDVERETILKNYMEKNPTISFDVNAITNITVKWEVKDIEKLIKVAVFKHILHSDLNSVSNEITDVILNLIEKGEFLPSRISRPSEEREFEDQVQYSQISPGRPQKIDNIFDKSVDIEESFVESIREESVSEFMLNQLYENAASKNYSELVIIIDKLKKKEPIDNNTRKILAKYPFILNDSPNQAEIYLEKAKKRVDHLKKVFSA